MHEKRRHSRLLGGQSGFTLVEIMIVVVTIGILAAIAVPSFIQSKQSTRRSICINNLKVVFMAKEQYTFDSSADEDTIPTAEDLEPYLRAGAMPSCPMGGDPYEINAISDKPACPTYAGDGHVLP